MVARLSRLIALAPVLVATLLLSGCAFVQAVTQRVRVADPAPEVEVRPDAPPEYDVLVAQQHDANGEMALALAALQRALEKDPDSAYLHRKIATALIRVGRPGKALEHAELALVLEPDEERTRIFLGRLHRLRRDAPAAEFCSACREPAGNAVKTMANRTDPRSGPESRFFSVARFISSSEPRSEL